MREIYLILLVLASSVSYSQVDNKEILSVNNPETSLFLEENDSGEFWGPCQPINISDFYLRTQLFNKLKISESFLPFEFGYSRNFSMGQIKLGGVLIQNLNLRNTGIGYSLIYKPGSIRRNFLEPFISFKHLYNVNSKNSDIYLSTGIEIWSFYKRMYLNIQYGSYGNKISLNNSFVGGGLTYLLL